MEVAASKQTSDRRPAQDLYGDVFPESWYAVMESDALRRGKALPVDALGKPLVLFRTASGAVTAMDRYCPHMGASLACGRVEGERIRCPFHAWEYDVKGVCRRIPYMSDDAIPRTARIPTIPVTEHLGWIWVYHGEAPAYALPDVPEARDPAFESRAQTQHMDAHPLMILENATDVQHLRFIHRVNFLKSEVEVLREEPHCFEFRVDQEIKGPLGTRRQVRITNQYAGASTIFGSIEAAGKLMARYIAAPLPIKSRRIAFHLIVFTRGLPWPFNAMNPLVTMFMSRQILAGTTDDYEPVWKHMNPARRRVLVPEDRLQQRFRSYYAAHLRAGEGDSALPLRA